MDWLQENFPVIALLVILFKEPIIKAIGLKFPFMMTSWVDDKVDRREFEQEEGRATLQDKLAASESERNLQSKREKEYWNIINRMVVFSQEILTQKIDDSENSILSELKIVRDVLLKMSEQFEKEVKK